MKPTIQGERPQGRHGHDHLPVGPRQGADLPLSGHNPLPTTELEWDSDQVTGWLKTLQWLKIQSLHGV